MQYGENDDKRIKNGKKTDIYTHDNDKFHAMEKKVPCHGEESSMPWRKEFHAMEEAL